MSHRDHALAALLHAATELAEARRHDSDTAEEWDALERAITASEESCTPTYEFSLYKDVGMFVRRSWYDSKHLERVDGCDIDDIEAVAQTIESDADPHGDGWFVVDELVAPSGRTWLKCLIAVEFMKRAGLLSEGPTNNRLSSLVGYDIWNKAQEAWKSAVDSQTREAAR